MEKYPLSKYQKTVMVLLALTQFTVVLDFMVMSPLGDILIKSMSLSPSQFSIAVSSYAFSAGISGIIAAGFADKYDRKSLLLYFYGGFIIGTLFCGMVTSYPLLVAARIFTGIFGGVLGAISMAIIVDVFKLEQRGRVMGIVQMGFAASQVLGIPVGLYLANIWDWHMPFLMIVALSILLFLSIYFLIKPVNEHLKIQNKDHSPFAHLLNIIKNKNYRIAFTTTALLSVGGYLMMPFGSAFAVNNLKLQQSQLPLIFMCTGVSSLIIMPLVGRLSDKIDKFKIFVFASIWASVFVIIYTNLGPTSISYVIPLNILLFMGIMSRMIPAGALTTSIPELKDRGGFMSLNGSLQQITGGVATLLAGFIIVQKDKNSPLDNYPMLGYIGVFFMVLCVFMLWRVNKIIKVQGHR
jgi:predicted MFS family arabinose efflux permease